MDPTNPIDMRALRLAAAMGGGDENRDCKLSLTEIRGQKEGYAFLVQTLETNLAAYRNGDANALHRTQVLGLSLSLDDMPVTWDQSAAEHTIATARRILAALNQAEEWSVAHDGADFEFFSGQIPDVSDTAKMFAVLADVYGNNNGHVTTDEIEAMARHPKATAMVSAEQQAVTELRNALAPPRAGGVSTGSKKP